MSRSVVGKKTLGSDMGGPVLGGYMPVTVYIDNVAHTTDTSSDVVNLDDVLPPGMKVRVLGASISVESRSAGTVDVNVGTSSDADAYVDALQLAAAGSAYSKCNGTGAADATVGDYEFDPAGTSPADELRVSVDRAGFTGNGITVILWLIPTAHNSDVAGR